MKTVHVLNCLHNSKARSHNRSVVARCLLVVTVLGMLVAPMVMRVQTVKASCRFTSTLRIIPDILTNIAFQRQGDKQWAFGFFLNQNRHIQLCPGNPFLPICNYDGFSYRPLLATGNISDVFSSNACNSGWVIQTSDTNDFTIGFRCKFEQDYVSLQVQNPAAQTFQIPVHTPDFVIGQTYSAADGQFQVTTVADSPD